jgi:hypothetical protein
MSQPSANQTFGQKNQSKLPVLESSLPLLVTLYIYGGHVIESPWRNSRSEFTAAGYVIPSPSREDGQGEGETSIAVQAIDVRKIAVVSRGTQTLSHKQ